MITSEDIESLFPLACQWVEEQEQKILQEGIRLTPDQQIDAYLIGIKKIKNIRIVPVDVMPRPSHPQLQPALEATGFLSESTIGVSYRYGIYLKKEYFQERRLVIHELVHTHQYERFGSIEAFLKQYFQECLTVGYFNSPLENEAHEMEQKILER